MFFDVWLHLGRGCPIQCSTSIKASVQIDHSVLICLGVGGYPGHNNNCVAFLPQTSNLPEGWEVRQTTDGSKYYVDHNSRLTTWEHPITHELVRERKREREERRE